MPDYKHLSATANEDYTVTVTTRTCMVCGNGGEITVSQFEWDMFMKHPEMFIQDVFKSLSAGERDQLISGIHDKCYDEMFPPDED